MQIRKLRKWNMYGIIYTVHVPLCSIHFLISLIDKRSSFPMLYNPTFLYTFVFSISWLLKPAMYAYKYRLAFLSETNRWLSINYQTKKVCLLRHCLIYKVWDDFIHIFDCFRSYNTFGLKKEKIAQCTCMINSTYGNNQKKTPDKNPTV